MYAESLGVAAEKGATLHQLRISVHREMSVIAEEMDLPFVKIERIVVAHIKNAMRDSFGLGTELESLLDDDEVDLEARKLAVANAEYALLNISPNASPKKAYEIRKRLIAVKKAMEDE
jgi:hypothetical protein